MKWYWYHEIGSKLLCFSRNDFCEARRKPLSQRLHALELQHHDGPDQRTVIDTETPRSIKARTSPCANHTVCTRLGFLPRCHRVPRTPCKRQMHRPPTGGAHCFRHRLKRRETLVADWHSARPCQQFFADPTPVRKQHAHKRIARLRH